MLCTFFRVTRITTLSVLVVVALVVPATSAAFADGSAPIQIVNPAIPITSQYSGVQPLSLSGCPSSSACFWENDTYQGTLWDFPISHNAQNTWLEVPGSMNDQASSLYNNRVNFTLIDKNYPPTGLQEACLGNQAVIADMSDWEWPDGTDMDNSISAVNLLSSQAC